MESFKLKKQGNKRQKLEYKQLQHDYQLIKIESAQKDYQLNNLKLNFANRCESLDERNNQLIHQNQILSSRLNEIVSVVKLYFILVL